MRNQELILCFLFFILAFGCCFYTKDGCTDTAMRCDGTRCISNEWLCDNEHDCIDGTDEANCTKSDMRCSSYQYKCTDSGKCIHKIWLCDGDNDCSKGEDEKNCDKSKSCAENEFHCDDKCINQWEVCDGTFDCIDMKDETNCTGRWRTTPRPKATDRPCNSKEFKCITGHCIDKDYVCDGDKDCQDASDELHCATKPATVKPQATCSSQQLQCNGLCLPKSFQCDGDRDCPDGSDEENCQGKICPDHRFMCHTTKRCILFRWTCDGESDCLDGSDERNCTSQHRTCPSGHFKCGTGKCIKSAWKCDGTDDCNDNSDEVGCKSTNPDPKQKCTSRHHQCRDRSCVGLDHVCDGIKDCTDGSDEDECEFSCENLHSFASLSSPQDMKNPSQVRSSFATLSATNTSWCVKSHLPDSWLQIDLGQSKIVRKLVTLGHPIGTEPGSDGFTMDVSYDGVEWFSYMDNNDVKVFPGNSVAGQRSSTQLAKFLKARYLRIKLVASRTKEWSCLRIGVLGCSGVKRPDVIVQSSVQLENRKDAKAVASCIVRGQQGFDVTWEMFSTDWKRIPDDDKMFKINDTRVTPEKSIWKKVKTHLQVGYDRDSILSGFNCHRKGDKVLCSAMFRCSAKYNVKDMGPSSVRSITVRVNAMALPQIPKSIYARIKSPSEAVVSWEVADYGDFPETLCSLFYKEVNGTGGPQTVYTSVNNQVTLTGLNANYLHEIRVGIKSSELLKQQVVGVKDYIYISEPSQFSTSVYGQSQINAFAIDSSSIVLQWEVIRLLSGKSASGYTVTYERTHIGPYPVRGIKQRKDVLSSLPRLTLQNLKAWSKYRIRITPSNAEKLGENIQNFTRITEAATKTARPTGTPQNVSALKTKSHKLEISWLPPPLETQNGPIQGYKVRVGGLSNVRTKRSKTDASKFRMVHVRADKLQVYITLPEDLKVCTVEVAAANDNGVGIYSFPLPVVLSSDVGDNNNYVKRKSMPSERSKDGSNKEFIAGISVMVLLVIILAIAVLFLAYKLYFKAKLRPLEHKVFYKGSDCEPFFNANELDDFSNHSVFKIKPSEKEIGKENPM